MPVTYKLIETVTVGAGGSAGITFSSIPQTYTDLVLFTSFRLSASGIEAVDFTLNSSTGANYNWRYVQGAGSSGINAGSGTSQTGFTEAMLTDGNTSTTSVFSNSMMYVANYSSTSTSKSLYIDDVEEENSATAYMRFTAGLWAQTAAISSIQITASSNFAQHSSASLYGIKNS